jgi:hypothetical protein
MATEFFWICKLFNDTLAAAATESATPFIDAINPS